MGFLYTTAMELTPVRIETLRPPEDDLYAKIRASALSLEEGDVIAISSKVVAIGQGRCVPLEKEGVDDLIRSEADYYLERDVVPGKFVMHTIKNGTLIPNAGIDPFGGHRILWPEKPRQAAEDLLAWFKKEYGLERLYLVITDSRSVFMRRGVVGMAIAWAGFDPLYDNRARKDLLGHASGGSQTNVPDALAAAAVYVMGEANESTPLVRIRNAPYLKDAGTTPKEQNADIYMVDAKDDIFAPFLASVEWKRESNDRGKKGAE